jgi:small-conductance mechanosensitive channel
MVSVRELLRRLFTERFELFLALSFIVLGGILGYSVMQLLKQLFDRFGVQEAVSGTPLDRTLQRFGSSTTGLVSLLSGLFVFGLMTIGTLRWTGYLAADFFFTRVADVLPQVFVAVVVVIAGVIVGERTALVISERLRSVKLPDINFLPVAVKWSIFYVAGLIALSQLGVATGALLVLLAAYSFGVVFVAGIAAWDLLRSAAAGVYLLLTEPYSIGDEVEIDGKRGIVQEVDAFVTHIESDGEEYIVPNSRVFKRGIVRVRE